MGYELRTDLADLYEEFSLSEKPKVSAQGYTTLSGIAKRVLLWLDAEDLDPLTLTIQDAVRFQSELSNRLTKSGAPIATGTMHNYLKVARRFYPILSRPSACRRTLHGAALPKASRASIAQRLDRGPDGQALGELTRFDELPSRRARLRRYRVHVLAEFLYATGLRIAEASALVPEDLDLAGRLVYVRSGKGERADGFLNELRGRVMARYLDTGRAATLHHFVRGHGETLFGADKARVAAVLNEELRKVCTALELPVMTSHGLRQSLGTHLARSGSDMRHNPAMLGHADIATTQIYTRVDKDDLKKSLDEYHPRQWPRPAAAAAAATVANT
jgi:site-specific recombinase XerD